MDIENPPAFPVNTSGQLEPSDGMTLRDWFAGQALSSVVTLLGRDVGTADDLAKDAYTIADAMLATRSGSAS